MIDGAGCANLFGCNIAKAVVGLHHDAMRVGAIGRSIRQGPIENDCRLAFWRSSDEVARPTGVDLAFVFAVRNGPHRVAGIAVKQDMPPLKGLERVTLVRAINE